MLCFGCGNEIPDGRECPICEAGRGRRRRADETRLCPGCGNEVPADEECYICATGLAPKKRAAKPAADDGAEPRTRLCTGCGNEVPADRDCAICAARAARHVAAELTEEPPTHFCRTCGNEVYADRPCPICEAARGRHDEGPRLQLCAGCGNEVEDVHHCPICLSGHGRPKKKSLPEGPVCPRCDNLLEEQDWDGVLVLMCPACQGSLFPLGGLEKTLDKLREATERAAFAEVLAEFRGRYTRKLPSAVRYKNCPICRELMTRRNYANVSGVIIDVCGNHGTWVDQNAFTDLADFISKGGDVLAARNLRRKR